MLHSNFNFNFIVTIVVSVHAAADGTRNTFCRTQESDQCNFFIFDHVTFTQFKICCTVQNFIKIGWFFTEIWQYIDFLNGGRPPSWNCFITIRDHIRSLCCWPQLPVKFHVSQSDTQIWRYSYLNFLHIWLEVPIQAPKMGFFGDFGPLNVIIHNRDPQKAHPCVNPRLLSYQLTVKIR